MYCNNLSSKTESIIPSNREAAPSQAYIDPDSLKASTSKSNESKIKIRDHGLGEYSISQALCIGKLPLSPHTYGKPQMTETTSNTTTIVCKPTVFKKWGALYDEMEDEDLLRWLYKDEDAEKEQIIEPKVKIPAKQYGKGLKIMERYGYDGHSPLGLHKQGILEPIKLDGGYKVTGLGYDTQKDKTLSTKGNLSEVGESSNATQTDEEGTIDDSNDFIDIYAYDSICTLEAIHNLEPNHDPLPLVHPQLIDWDHKGPSQLDFFKMMRQS